MAILALVVQLHRHAGTHQRLAATTNEAGCWFGRAGLPIQPAKVMSGRVKAGSHYPGSVFNLIPSNPLLTYHLGRTGSGSVFTG